MKYLFMIIFLVITPLSFASTTASEVPIFDWAALLITLLGENGKLIVAWLSVILVIWAQVRQLIPASWMAKLPVFLINLLEFLAANNGQARNEALNDPIQIKRARL